MTRAALAVLALASLLAAGCDRARETPPAPVDPALFSGERALQQVADLVALGPRVSGTQGAQRAAFHLLARLRELGIDARIDVFTNRTPAGVVTFRNVVGTIPGSGAGVVILGSHFDTKAGIDGFVGANDSGSSSGALLEIARVLATSPRLGPTVELVFFDGEEAVATYGPNDGLQGSRRHARRYVEAGRAKEIRAMILMDMVGDRHLTVTLPKNSTSWLVSLVLQAAHAEDARRHFSLYPFEIGDDHQPFLDIGVPAVNIIDFEYGSAPGMSDIWHTAEDTMDKLSADSLRIVGRVVLRVLNEVAARSGGETR